ncbi:MAG TPA: hypothetical protein VK627_03280, partial [Edaphobacter sp.]|nr:hypothetical protein [Edaphobacter sp.]
GITTGILCSPLLPGITDSEEALDAMASRAAAVGASFFSASPLFLKPCSRPTYLSFVREHFPSLQADYAKRFDHADFAAAPYRRQMAEIVERVRHKYNLGQRSKDASLPRTGNDERKPPANTGTAQQKLFA